MNGAVVVVQERGVGSIAAGGNPHHGLAWCEARGINDPPCTVDERLGHRVEIHWLAPRRVHRHQTGRNIERAQQRDDEMRIFATHSCAGEQRVSGAIDRIAGARDVVQSGTNP